MAFEVEEPDGVERLKIPNTREIIFICGKSGSGKSTTTQTLVYQYYKQGYKIVYVTEKPKSAMENCFMMFEPTDPNHIKNLKRQRFKSIMKKEFEPLPIEIYHPFTFPRPRENLLKESLKLPKEFNFYTININSLTRRGLSAILSLNLDSSSVDACMRILNKYRKDLNIFSLVDSVYKSIHKTKISISNMGQTEHDENKKDIRTRVKNSFYPFTKDFVLQPEDSKYNLDMVKILNNHKVTFFTYKYIKDDKIRYFLHIHLLELIDDAIASDKINKPVVIVLEEIKILLPKSVSDQESYQAVLSTKLRNMLAGLRSQGQGVTTIATTQSYNDTNREFKTGGTQTLLHAQNYEDIKSYKRDSSMSSENEEIVKELKRGQLVNFNEATSRDVRANKITVQMPPFAIKIEGYKGFLAYYKKIKPEGLVPIKPFVKEMQELLKLQFKAFEEKEIEYRKKKKEEEKVKEKPKEIIQIKIPANQDKNEYIYNDVKNILAQGNELPSYRDLGKKFSVSPITIRRTIILQALKEVNWELVDKFASERFVATKMASYYKQIFEAPRL